MGRLEKNKYRPEDGRVAGYYTPMTDQFDKLFQSIKLASEGRMSAAKSIWDALLPNFRLLVMKFVVLLCQHTTGFADYSPGVVIESEHGQFTISEESLNLLRTYVPLVLAHAS